MGQKITTEKVSKSNQLLVQLTLADGSRIELSTKSVSPAPGPAFRTKSSVRGDRTQSSLGPGTSTNMPLRAARRAQALHQEQAVVAGDPC